MKKDLVAVMAFLALLCSVSGAGAGMIRAYYSGVAVSGTQEKEDLSAGLKAMLVSRLNGNRSLPWIPPRKRILSLPETM
jgi:hypothetical protein